MNYGSMNDARNDAPIEISTAKRKPVYIVCFGQGSENEKHFVTRRQAEAFYDTLTERDVCMMLYDGDGSQFMVVGRGIYA